MVLEEYAGILGTLAAIFGTAMSLAYFPQIYKLYKRKSAADISLLMFSTFFVGVTIWLLYGFSINNFPLIIANLIGLIGIAGVLIMYFKYRK